LVDKELKTRIKNRMLVINAANEDLQSLRILVDVPSYKLVQKLYQQYISEGDFSKFHSFMSEMDRLLSRFGGHPLPPPAAPGQAPSGNNNAPPQQDASRQRGTPVENPQQTQQPTPTPNAPAPVEDDEDE
jgi:hypothetical protein